MCIEILTIHVHVHCSPLIVQTLHMLSMYLFLKHDQHLCISDSDGLCCTRITYSCTVHVYVYLSTAMRMRMYPYMYAFTFVCRRSPWWWWGGGGGGGGGGGAL